MASPRSLARCPTCSAPLPEDTAKRVGSFCSKRCHTIDLGRWLQGEYSLPSYEGVEEGFAEADADDGYLH